jgi:hypothetical protein
LLVLGALVVLALLALTPAPQTVSADSTRPLHPQRLNTDIDLPSNFQLQQWETKPDGGWINGNLGSSNSDYAEGETVPQRLELGGIDDGTYDVTICRDFSNGTKRGYLYLDDFDTSRPADPGGTIISSMGPFDGVFVTINSFVDNNLQGPCDAGALATSVNITIDKEGGSIAYLLWGGHLAAPGDTDPVSMTLIALGNGAASYPGASLHMAIESPQKDNSINPSAILPAPLLTVRKFLRVPGGDPVPLLATADDQWCFTLTGPENQNMCIPEDSNVVTFSSLDLGSYTVEEDLPVSGYLFYDIGATSIRCTQVNDTASASANLTATEPTATCDFVNQSVSTVNRLGKFKAVARAKNVKLVWRTISEFDVFAFNVLRSSTKDGVYEVMNDAPIPAKYWTQFLGARYVYKDKTALAGQRYYYQIELLGMQGALEHSEIKRVRKPPNQEANLR